MGYDGLPLFSPFQFPYFYSYGTWPLSLPVEHSAASIVPSHRVLIKTSHGKFSVLDRKVFQRLLMESSLYRNLQELI